MRRGIIDTSPGVETMGAADGRGGVNIQFGDVLVPDGRRVSTEIALKQLDLAV